MQCIYTKLAAVILVEVIILVQAGHYFMHDNVILILQVISACFLPPFPPSALFHAFSPLSSCETCCSLIARPVPAFHPSKVRDY